MGELFIHVSDPRSNLLEAEYGTEKPGGAHIGGYAFQGGWVDTDGGVGAADLSASNGDLFNLKTRAKLILEGGQTPGRA